MARLIHNTVTQLNKLEIIVIHDDDSTESMFFLKDDFVENLRYIQNEELKTVTGNVANVTISASGVTPVDKKHPVDYFSKDCKPVSISIDASEQYHSNIVTIPAREIVENEGVQNVKKVDNTIHPFVTMQMEYTDGSTFDQELEVGDYLKNFRAMTKPGKPDIYDNVHIAAWSYTINAGKPIINGIWVRLSTAKYTEVMFKDIVEFEEIPTIEVTNPNSLSDVAELLNEQDYAEAVLGVDVEIPKRDDGRITTLMVPAGKTLDLDLNGHSLDCEAYAFYVTGGTLNISDTTGNGAIKCHRPGAAYPAVNVLSGGVCNMISGVIDTTEVDTEGSYNWLYGVVCSGDGIFNMTGGIIITAAASGIAITNGTASGEGAQFIIGGDAKIVAEECASVYLADNKRVVVKDNAVLEGGMVVRMGDISVEDNAIVYGTNDASMVEDLGNQVCMSGVGMPKAAILALTGVYNSSLGNDMNITVAPTAKLVGYIDDVIDIATINIKYNQKVTVDIPSKALVGGTKYRVYGHDELAEMAAAVGKALGAETSATDLTITMDGEQVYPVVD